MKKPDYKAFDFRRLLSENNHCQSWLAVNRETDKLCLVKTPSANSELGPNAGKSILSESYRCQKSIRSGRIVRAIGKYLAQGTVLIEYPYLDPTDWTVLTPELFFRHFQTVAPQIASTVDFIHTLGFVHCDLKLDNFLIRTSGRETEVVLVDLDFLCRENTDTEARVLGTPAHIAPEILANDRIVTQSDMYSLGISFSHCLQDEASRLEKEINGGSPADERLAALVEEMTRKDYLRRPRFLLESLHLSHLMERSAFDAAQKSLLATLLVSRFRTAGSSGLDTTKGMEKFLLRDNKILGPGDELLGRLAAAFAADRRKTLRVFRELLAEAVVDRNADYWHLELADQQLLQMYDRLAEVAGDLAPVGGKKAAGKSKNGGDALSLGRELVSSGHLEHAYLYLRGRWDGIKDTADDRLSEEFLSELISLTRSLNRLGEAEKCLASLTALKEKLGEDASEALFDRVHINIVLGHFDVADDLLRSSPSLASTNSGGRLDISLRRMRAWILQNRREYDQARELLQDALKEAKEKNLADLIVLILYNLGVLYWRQGDYKRSDEFLMESFETAERENILAGAVPVISSLSMLSYEQADYTRAIKFGKLASKVGTEPHHLPWLPSICSNIANAQIRLADFPKAEYWLQRYLSQAPRQSSKAYLLAYYLEDGYLNYNRGDIVSARDSLYKARQLIDQKYVSKGAGKVYHNLAEVALTQGKFTECGENLSAARAIFEENNDEASLAELDLIGTLREIYSGESRDLGRLISQAPFLIERGCRYYAVLCLYHALLNASVNDYHKISRAAEPLKEVIWQSRPPLFRAVAALLEALALLERGAVLPVAAWKQAFLALLDGSQKYLAMLAGIEIADQYAESANSKAAKKFLLQSRGLAEALDNDHMTHAIRTKLERVSKAADNSARLIELFLGISKILTDLSDYSRSLQSLVQFSVDQTGAERGVIFLKSQEGADLTVAAALNCDDRSLSDIKDFSMNIPHAAIKQLSPLIIENALSDQRTNKYESIVAHNILSVICVPLTLGSQSLGALYLDHHTIPALFDKEDLTFITSLANFMAVALSAAQDMRSRVLTNLQMKQDLQKLGAQQPFITRDPFMLDLLKKLPQIAATKTSVLLMGESGTGKEILGNMIHEHSPRGAKPLIKCNLATLPDTMVEAELFGIVRNAATGVAEREGKFSAADGGTMYLDEIGDMPPNVQVKVLRVLGDTQEFERVGSNHTITTDIRFVYATNRNLREMVKNGDFREDLFYRINNIVLEISPLRERKVDIPLLIDHYLKVHGKGKVKPKFSAAAIETLVEYAWPGNVRELSNIVERLGILFPGEIITPDMLPEEMRKAIPSARSLKAQREAEEAELMRVALVKHNRNISAAAREMKMPVNNFRRRMKKYNIKQL